MAESNYFVLKIPSRAENVGLARIAVAALASHLSFGLGEIEEIKVAVSEAVSNAILHAYPGEGEVEVTGEITPEGRLRIRVSDRGRGIEDVAQAREAGFSTAPDRMGLGFQFMESFMDRLEIDSGPDGTSVTMEKGPSIAGPPSCVRHDGEE